MDQWVERCVDEEVGCVSEKKSKRSSCSTTIVDLQEEIAGRQWLGVWQAKNMEERQRLDCPG